MSWTILTAERPENKQQELFTLQEALTMLGMTHQQIKEAITGLLSQMPTSWTHLIMQEQGENLQECLAKMAIKVSIVTCDDDHKYPPRNPIDHPNWCAVNPSLDRALVTLIGNLLEDNKPPVP